MKNKKTRKEQILDVSLEEQYVEFLRKRLASENYKANVSEEEYIKTKAKYDKAKFKLKMMKES